MYNSKYLKLFLIDYKDIYPIYVDINDYLNIFTDNEIITFTIDKLLDNIEGIEGIIDNEVIFHIKDISLLKQ